jgi:hypothetical protein
MKFFQDNEFILLLISCDDNVLVNALHVGMWTSCSLCLLTATSSISSILTQSNMYQDLSYNH